MKTDCCKAVLFLAVVGTIGSLIGWYWDALLGCLTQDIHHVHFGPVLLWLLIFFLVVKSLNRFIFKG
ncbi:MAG: hypothetical protein ACOYB3_01500 [Azonexus sp.]